MREKYYSMVSLGSLQPYYIIAHGPWLRRTGLHYIKAILEAKPCDESVPIATSLKRNQARCFPAGYFVNNFAADDLQRRAVFVKPEQAVFELLGGKEHAKQCVNSVLCSVCGLKQPASVTPPLTLGLTLDRYNKSVTRGSEVDWPGARQ